MNTHSTQTQSRKAGVLSVVKVPSLMQTKMHFSVHTLMYMLIQTLVHLQSVVEANHNKMKICFVFYFACSCAEYSDVEKSVDDVGDSNEWGSDQWDY